MDDLGARTGHGLWIDGDATPVRQLNYTHGIFRSPSVTGHGTECATSRGEGKNMKRAIILAATDFLMAGPAAAQCVTSPITNIWDFSLRFGRQK